MQYVEPTYQPYSRNPRVYPWRVATVAFATAVLAWVAMGINHEGGPVSPVWIGNAVVLSVLLGTPRTQWLVYLLSALAGNVTASLLMGDNLDISLALSCCNIAEIAIAAAPWWKHPDQLPDFTRFSVLRTFALCGMLTGPLVSGVLASAALWFLRNTPFMQTFAIWTPGDALGLAVFTPLLVSLRARQITWLFSPAQWLSSTLWLTGTVVIAVLVFGQNHYPILFLCLPVLLGCVFSMGLHGGLLAVVLTGSIAVGLTLQSHGPMMLVHTNDPTRMLLLQGFILTCVMTVFPVAAALAERRRLEARLRQRETQFRLMTEASDDMTVLLDSQLVRVYVSPAARTLYGAEPNQLLGLPAFHNAHEADREIIAAAFEALDNGEESASTTHRIKRLDTGEWQWIDALYRRMEGREFSQVRYLLNLRDATQQKEAQLALEAANKHLITLATVDSLTGIANRHCFDQDLTQEWQRTIRSASVIGLLFLDVDQFKAYNDLYGHPTGDQALYQIAQTIEDVARRPGGMAARYGGEEFAVILPDTDIVGCFEVAERIRKQVINLRIPHSGNGSGQITISIGAACMYPLAGDHAKDLLRRADEAVYQAKATGRNRVSVAG